MTGILTREEVQAYRERVEASPTKYTASSWYLAAVERASHLCASHEELRAERDAAATRAERAAGARGAERLNRLEAEERAERLLSEVRAALTHYADEAHWSEDAGDIYTTFTYDGGHSLPWSVARAALAVGGES